MTGEAPILTTEEPIKPLKLLFVDDIEESAESMARIAITLGHIAKWATSEPEAKMMLSAEPWDGLVTDWYLAPEKIPGGGGRIVAWLRAKGNNMPCIIITGYPSNEYCSIGSVLEMFPNVLTLQKPQDPQSLVSFIKGMTDSKQSKPTE